MGFTKLLISEIIVISEDNKPQGMFDKLKYLLNICKLERLSIAKKMSVILRHSFFLFFKLVLKYIYLFSSFSGAKTVGHGAISPRKSASDSTSKSTFNSIKFPA